MDPGKEGFFKNLINCLDQKRRDLEGKINQAKKRIGKAESARASWSDHTLTDIEDEISILTQQRNTVEAQLKEIRAFQSQPSSSDRVIPGSLVTIELEGEKQTLLVVNSSAGSFEQGLLSAQSPLGKGIVGKGSNQSFTVPTPVEPLKVRILKIA